MLAAIWAQDQQGLIGANGTLPWHLPNDLKFFKETTIHHTVVMGRKTFEGMGKRVLPERKTIILTRDVNYQAEGIEVLHSVKEVLNEAEKDEELFYIIGGAELFQAFLPYLDILHRTVIHEIFDGDIYFPEIDWQKWQKVSSTEGIIDEKNHYAHTFEKYKRK